mmetsp:Transcript_28806/g.54385  ORF Transcript_28806/g.54385 Transcript_28806/m.54385 type:complete len:259 (-) Transcript_28806:1544-2320(-)
MLPSDFQDHSQDDVECVPIGPFYSTYHGHDTRLLSQVLRVMRKPPTQGNSRVIFLAGDSSLDNKFWLPHPAAAAVLAYKRVLRPPLMKQDVAYWMNFEAERRGAVQWNTINTAVEATSLNDRAFGRLLAQDTFIRDNITSEDVLVVSIGGNDVALQPLLGTIIAISALVCCTPQLMLEHCACAAPPNLNVDCGCLCCGLPGCISGLVGWPIGFGYVVDMFKNRVQNYISRLVSKCKPSKIVVCMIYFLDEKSTGSWAV